MLQIDGWFVNHLSRVIICNTSYKYDYFTYAYIQPCVLIKNNFTAVNYLQSFMEISLNDIFISKYDSCIISHLYKKAIQAADIYKHIHVQMINFQLHFFMFLNYYYYILNNFILKSYIVYVKQIRTFTIFNWLLKYNRK